MGDWYVGEIRLFTMSWNPQDWLLCDGSILQITANQALYSLLGTTFGGNGQTTFALPDLRGRTPVGTSSTDATYLRGKAGGAETVTLTATQIPPHMHSFQGSSTTGTTAGIGPGVTVATVGTSATVTTAPFVFTPTPTGTPVPLNPATVGTAGGATGHSNIQPSLTLNFCIARNGVYPPRN